LSWRPTASGLSRSASSGVRACSRTRHPVHHQTEPLPPFRSAIGPINAFALAFALLTTVAFLFPPATNPTGSSMNYVCVVVGSVSLSIQLAFATPPH
jgi:protein-S-isoprenylcysteine O-methyltransferase Ste14